MAERDAGTTTGESGTVILRGTDGDPIHIEDAPPPGTRLGRYALQRPLGRGGMGIVMEAYDPELARTVAIKLVRPGTGGPRAAQRLLREARALARLQHPAIISVFEVGKERGQSFICMECVAGRTLRRWLA